MAYRVQRLAGCRERGWVWCDENGLHVRDNYVIERYRNYMILGGTTTVLACKPNLSNVSVLCIDQAGEAVHVREHELPIMPRCDIVVGAKYAYITTKDGLEVRNLPDFTLHQRWPGKFLSACPLEDNGLAVVNYAGTVSFLQNDRWDMRDYSIHAEHVLSDHRIIQTYNPSVAAWHWCPQHKHRVKLAETGVAQAVCNGPTYLLYSDGRYRLFCNENHLWTFTTSAVYLINENMLVCVQNNAVQEWPKRWWGMRLVLLLWAGLPLGLVESMKKYIV